MPILGEGAFRDLAQRNPLNAALLDRLPSLGLDQCYLTAGCLFQAVWNHASNRPADDKVKDYDVFYFDDGDLSWEAEDRVIKRVVALCADLGATIEVKNQARVHLWYERRFGSPYPALRSTRDGIDRFLVACICVGIDVSDRLLYTPDGLGDLQQGVLKINRLHPNPALFRRKAEDYRARWGWLRIVDSEA